MALKGLHVVEMAGLAPAPLCGMILADFGAQVTRIDKIAPSMDTLTRGKRSIAVNLKKKEGQRVVRRVCQHADVVLEPFRPGVMEKLGLGPDVLCKENPRLIYARLTGFGQTGAYASRAGHDINYLAVSGVLSMLGRHGQPPTPPINLLADFAGGSLTCALGILAAVVNRASSGKGQVVDAAMVDGVAYLSSFLHTSQPLGFWQGERGTNLLDTGAPFYDTYQTKDGGYMSVGAIEPQFYRKLLAGLGLDADNQPDQMDQESWPEMRSKFEDIFASRNRDEWSKVFDGIDACVMPVLGLQEAASHPHNVARNLVAEGTDGTQHPNPAPHLSRTPATPAPSVPLEVGQHSVDILTEIGFSEAEIGALVTDGVVMSAEGHAPSHL